jgi:two-component system, OmpR family, osmolarity sensor histidine kinase EnvZ
VTLAPRSLFGRNILLLLVLFIFGLACGGLTLRVWVQRPRIAELAELVSRQVLLAHANLTLVPEEQRASMRPWLNSWGGVTVLPVAAEKPPTGLASPELLALQFMRDLQWRLPDALQVLWAPINQGTVWVRMRVGDDEYWFIERGVYLEGDVSAAGIGTLIVVAALSVSGAALIQRRINRPLAHLVEAARTLALGKRVAPLDERAPEELAVVSRAFNQMTASLARAEAERAILLAGVSHDLRTPIAKMRLAIEMLRGHGDVELVDSMLRSTAELQTVTDQFMYYARQQDKSEFVKTDLSSLVLESVEQHRSTNRPIHIDLRSDCTLALHPESIRRAIDNLIENALRYSEADIEVATDCRDGFVRISVLDRGPGIPASEVQTLKLPFARGSASVGTPGTGLGLAIVERIAAAHDGRFELLPREGGGLEARIELPCSKRVAEC